MSARSYLSIGDVLTLLRQEFPDVTISKIRFLESQGLVNPERTPSGYRKFYEHDVERLRWVLRQQREHFLPLKVIKDRLDEDGAGSETTAAAAAPVRAPAVGTPAVAGTAAEAAAADVPAAGRTVTTAPTAEPVLVGHQAAAPGRTASAGRTASSGPASSGPASSGPGSSDPSSALPGIEASGPRTVAAPTASTGPPSRRAGSAPASRPAPRTGGGQGSGNGTTGRRAATPAGADKPASRTPRSGAVAAGAAAAPGPDTTAAPAPGAHGGASLTLDELCAASGLTAESVGQLQEYGLVRAAFVGGTEYFDDEALTVATVAAKFAAFGIEARHLRLYKNAADREAGFIEQVVIPMVRQRNPEARARAGQTADDLAALGLQLRGSLLRTGLGDLLNG